MTLYPLVFEPILVEKVWGGRALERFGKTLPPRRSVGESWEIADLPPSIPDGCSIVANGPWRGMTLHEVIAKHSGDVMGDARLSGGDAFPLLIKLLDAQENLSVQVHPDTEYVARHPEAHLKSEAWYVVEAKPGAVIYKGLRAGLTADLFAEHIRTGQVAEDLSAVPAIVGDYHYLPSGTCHALGGGVLVAEVQTPSDTTFRVFDWGRTSRDLHVEQALECIDFSGPPPACVPGSETAENGARRRHLLSTDYFAIERVEVEVGGTIAFVPEGSPEVWMNLAGEGEIRTTYGLSVDLMPGTTTLLPAAMEAARAAYRTHATLLRITLPSPGDRVVGESPS